MFQSFDVTARPEQGPDRLEALRSELSRKEVDGFLVPRADAHQGEYVAPRDERLSWLTGFTGSAGFCAALHDIAGVFIDGRYRTQVKQQVADVYTPVSWPEVSLAAWLIEQLPNGGSVAYDPWLHPTKEIRELTARLAPKGILLTQTENLVDRVWTDQPAAPANPVFPHPLDYAGETAESKITRLAASLRAAGQSAAIVTLPDNLMWLLNLRGSDIARNPVAHGFAILHADARVDLFMDANKLAGITLPEPVSLHAPETFLEAVAALTGTVAVDETTLPQAVADACAATLEPAGDPCALPKARKNTAEIEGSAAAHLRDGAAVVETLAWLDAQPPGTITEIDVVKHLEDQRRQDNALRDISFETISGTGPNGAVIHYRVTEETNRTLAAGDLLVLDSGAQYLDGTTDITRTLAVGTPGDEERAAFTRVLQGMIAISRLRWPRGLAGRDIEAIGRVPLWSAGQDFNHGLGHGVGAYLSVHEGPQRLSRMSHVPLEPGMILSNEPGYYREGAFGIRIENLIVVTPAEALPTSDQGRDMLSWRTLTFVPIDRRLIDADSLCTAEKDWLNAYHAEVLEKILPQLSAGAAEWLKTACAPL
ncbi:putative peptidase [Tritonibacter multivorans]|uniref:Putative peptidase n=1 Tax=Tritonibacter multivorans TaxID=928856 RepID=A0A0P1GFV7_9RHOB|nr:aminopeptidase P family protein [Tritonibacter multivorans]MDA7421037.1 aminopeptidase P family protein [Tritonibacter multivorans]CUH80302.1 putative peptidase [Tritonibacter multivorans]SFC77644.1 Xaa-Pro aminopeptidase [Tritonibacter multivorans]